MKKIFVAMMLTLVFTTSAWTDTYQVEAPTKFTQKRMDDGGYLISLNGPLAADWVLYAFHQDNKRGLNVKKQKIQPCADTSSHKEWKIDPFTIRVGQVMFNLYSPSLNLWLGIPNCLVTLGEGLAFGYTYPSGQVSHDGDWDKPGGTAIVLTASGIPVQYPVDNFDCGGNIAAPPQRAAAPPAHRVAPPAARAAAPPRRTASVAQGPCGKDPCLNAIKQDTKLIPEIRANTFRIMTSLGMPTASDPPGKRTVHEKLNHVMKTTDDSKKAVGDSPSNTPLHEKIGEPTKKGDTVMGKLNDIEKTVKDTGCKVWWMYWLPLILLGLLLLALVAWLISRSARNRRNRRDEDLRRREEAIRAEERARAAEREAQQPPPPGAGA